MLTLFGTPDALTVRDLTISQCRDRALVNELIADWHSRLPNPLPGFKVAFLVSAPNLAPVAVATWGRPIARMEDQETTLELTRQAHGPTAPRNTGTWMLGKMRRWIRENMPEIVRLISYQDADYHQGTIYKADNWKFVYDQCQSATWHTRPGRAGTEVAHKIKWERQP